MLNRPTKHPRNPLVIRDKSWEGYAITHGSVVHDPKDGVYKLWYNVWHCLPEAADHRGDKRRDEPGNDEPAHDVRNDQYRDGDQN